MASKTKRRQAAALVVQSFFTMGKKSTAQPRPALHVPPRGIGPIQEPNINDVLCGRGGRINAHEGNVQFREIVAANKKEYLAKTTKKLEKAHIAARIVEMIRTMDPPGRILKEDSETGFWFDIGDAKAIKKAGQALREDAPDIRTDGGEGSDDDKSSPSVKKSTPKSTPSGPSTKKSSSLPSPRKPSSSHSKKSVPPSSSASMKSLQSRGSNRMPTTTKSGRGSAGVQNHPRASFHSAGSSSFGMPFASEAGVQGYPAQQQAPSSQTGFNTTGSGTSFPTTSSVGSGKHSLQSGGMFPTNLYAGVRNMSTNMSKRAAEMMHFQQQQHHAAAAAHYRQAHPGGPPGPPGQYPPGQHPDEVAFGRQFTPTELSSGSTMSTISGMSGISGFSNNTGSNLAGSHLGGASALSLGSSGFGAPSPMPGQARLQSLQSLRTSQLGPTGLRAQQKQQRQQQQAGMPAQYSTNSTARRGSQVSDMTNSFMSASGLTRSPSFGDLSSSVAMPMSDSSFVALMAEDRAVGNVFANMPPPLNSSGTSSKSSSSRFKQQPSSAMSVTSAGSNRSAITLSMRSIGSDTSWLQQHPHHRSNTKGSICSGEGGEEGSSSRMWADDRSLMSDVSESIVALDLAAPPY